MCTALFSVQAQREISVGTFDALRDSIATYGTATENIIITVTANIPNVTPLTIPGNNSEHTLTIRSTGVPATLTRGAFGNLFIVHPNATLILDSIIIDGNRNVDSVVGGSLVQVNGGTLVINSGAILQNNNSEFTAGGGVSVNSGGFTMNGGQITGNSSNNIGGGVFMGGTFTLGGTAVITDNTVAVGRNNVFLDNRHIVLSSPAAGMQVGVTTAPANNGIFVQNGANAGHVQHFFADDTNRRVILYPVEQGVLRVALPNTVTIVGGTITNDTTSGRFFVGDTVRIRANPPSTGFEFKNWTTTPPVIFANENNDSTTFIMPLSNVTVTAVYEAIVYNIIFNLNDGSGTVDSATYTVTTPTFSLPIPTRMGWTFDGWFDNAGLTGTAITQIQQGDTGHKEFWARWQVTVYTITFNLNGGDSLSPAPPSNYTIETDTITLPTTPTRDGFTFGGWRDDTTGVMITLIPQGSTGNRSFTAQWNLTTFTITYHLDGGSGNMTPTSYTVETGTITLPIPTRNGFAFGGWFDNADHTGTAITQIPQGSIGNKTFWARWDIIVFNITYVLNGGTNHPDNPVSFNILTPTIVLQEPTRDGFTFSGWAEGNIIPIGSTGNRTFTAQWFYVSIVGSNPICIGQTTQLQTSINNGTWESNNDAIASIDPITGLVTGLSSGTTTFTFIEDGTGARITTPLVAVSSDRAPEINNGIGVRTDPTGMPYLLTFPNVAGDFFYQWYHNNAPIAGANSQFYYSPNGLQAGTYKVFVAYAHSTSCGSFTQPLLVDLQRRSISPELFFLYPNPSDGRFSVIFNKDIISDTTAVTISLFSLQGARIVEQQVIGSQTFEFDENLNNGIYVLRVTTDSNLSETRQIIINN